MKAVRFCRRVSSERFVIVRLRVKLEVEWLAWGFGGLWLRTGELTILVWRCWRRTDGSIRLEMDKLADWLQDRL